MRWKVGVKAVRKILNWLSRKRVKESIGRVSQSVEKVHQSVGNVTQSVENVTQNVSLSAEKLTQSVEKVSQSIGKLAQSVEKVTHTTDNVSQSIEHLNHSVEALTKTVGTMEVDQKANHAALELLIENTQKRNATPEILERLQFIEDSIGDIRRQKSFEEFLEGVERKTSLHDGLSILIPCFHQAGLLRDAVASAIAVMDLLPAGEIIIFDDGSMDETPEVCQEVAAESTYVKVLRSEHNLGLSRVRILLALNASYKHFISLDADKRLAVGAKQVYDSAVATGATMTLGTIRRWRDGKYVGVMNHGPVTGDISKYNMTDAMSICMTERVLDRGGWYIGPYSISFEDWELDCRLARHGELFAHVPTIIGDYRQSSLSLSQEVAIDDVPSTNAHRRRRINKFYDFDGQLAERIRSCVFHPSAGWLWKNKANIGEEYVADGRSKVLVIAPPAHSRAEQANKAIDDLLADLQAENPKQMQLVVSEDDVPIEPSANAIWLGALKEFDRTLPIESVTSELKGMGDDRLEKLLKLVSQNNNSHQHLGRIRLDFQKLDEVVVYVTSETRDISLIRRLMVGLYARSLGIPARMRVLSVGPMAPQRKLLWDSMQKVFKISNVPVCDSKNGAVTAGDNNVTNCFAWDALHQIGIEKGQAFHYLQLVNEDFADTARRGAVVKFDKLAAIAKASKRPIVVVTTEGIEQEAFQLLEQSAGQHTYHMLVAPSDSSVVGAISDLAERL